MTDVEMMTRAVEMDPDDATAAGALYDALQEAGRSPVAARRAANAIVRDAAAAKLLADARKLVRGGTARAARLRSIIRRAAGCDRHLPPITVTAGDAVPTLTGEAPVNVFRGGGVCRSPGSALRRGHRVEYRASTLAVTVGAGWVRDHAP